MGLETAESEDAQALAELAQSAPDTNPADKLRALIRHHADRLPLPGSGRTLARWRALAEVASNDLGLAKLYEGHTDALAILAELRAPAPRPGQSWGVWCAEPPGDRVEAAPAPVAEPAPAAAPEATPTAATPAAPAAAPIRRPFGIASRYPMRWRCQQIAGDSTAGHAPSG